MRPSSSGRIGRIRGVLLSVVAGVAVLVLGLAVRGGPSAGTGSFVLGWTWGLVVLAALVGWGRACNKLLLPDTHRGWGMRGAWGMALTVAVGGVLNLLGLISPGVVFVFLAAGVAFLVWRPSVRWRGSERFAARDPVVLLLLAIVAGLAMLQYSASVAGTVDTVHARPAFDAHDDLQGYLFFPTKMLQTGSLGKDPFEPRRALSLGGQSFLDTLILSARPFRALHVLDEGIAMLIVLGLILGAGRRRGLGPRPTVLLAFLALSLPHLEMRGNTSALFTGVALLLAWFFEELEEPSPAGRYGGRWVLIGLLVAAACAVKSTFIPFTVIFFGLTLIAGVTGRENRRRTLGGAALIAAVTVVTVAPWMISVRLSSGTFLYPVFGEGFLGAASTHGFPAVQGDFGVSAVAVAIMIRRRLLDLLPVVLLLIFAEDPRPRRPVTALALGAVLTAVVLVIAGDTNLNHSLIRYTFPLAATALLGVAVASLEDANRKPAHLRVAVAVAVVVMTIFAGRARLGEMMDQVLVNVGQGVKGEQLVPEADREGIRRLQAALPEGASVLATLRYPFLLDNRRNQVFIMSLPGFSSPPPGLPVDGGAEAIASYLRGQGVRYLAYGGMDDIKDLLGLTEKKIRTYYPRSQTRWAMLIYHRLYRQEVQELTFTRRVLYSDARRVLVDLAVRETTVLPPAVPDRLGFYADNNWTDGDGLLPGLDVTVPPAARELEVMLYPAHPQAADPASLGLEVLVNGVNLVPVGAEPLHLRFALPRLLRCIHMIELRSSTFIPKHAGVGEDTRRLGVPVAKIVIPPPEG